MSVIYPNYASVGHPQNGFPMVYFAPPPPPQQPFQSQAPQVYDPAHLAMPPFVPEQQPIYYTLDPRGNYVLLTPQQYAPTAPSVPKDLANGENHQMLLSAAYSDGSVDSVGPHDLTPSFYDAYNLNTSGASRKSAGGGGGGNGKSHPSPAYKTIMCNMFSTSGTCTYGAGCQYAHGPEEMRPIIPHPKYKTILCNKFNSPHGCQYGEKCHFRHPDDPQPHGTPATPKTTQRKPSHGSGKKKRGHRAGHHHNAQNQKTTMPNSVSVNAAKTAENKDAKQKDSLIKLSMYPRFDSYVGKNRSSKPDALKRTNSSNTVGTYTLQRYVNMKKAVDYMRDVKMKPHPDAAAVMKQQEMESSSFIDEQQEVAAKIDKINLSS